MHKDISEAKIRAAKEGTATKELRMCGDDMCADLYNAKVMRLEIVQMLDERKEENLQRISRHEENEISLKNRIQANEANNIIRGVDNAMDIHGRDQLAKCVSKQNELLAQVELIEEIERYMKGQEVQKQ